MGTKVKITKRQIKEDKFTTFMLQTRDRFMEYWQIITIVTVIIVLAIAGVMYFSSMRASKKIEAANRLNAAILEARRQNYQVAILELGTVADEYSGHIAGQAVFSLANAHYESKNYDEAIANFQKYIDKYHFDRLTTASAIAGIASSLENKQEFLAAGDKYYEATQSYVESPLAPDHYLGAVRCYVMAGNRDKVETMLREIEEKFPNTEYSRTAIRLAMSLRTSS